MQFAWGFGITQALATAIDLDLFTHIDRGAATTAELVEGSVRPDAVRRVLDAMVAAGLVERDGDRHALAPDADAFLVRGKPSFLGDFVVFHARDIASRWSALSDVVRTGAPERSVDRPEDGGEFWKRLVDSLFAVNFRAAQVVGRELARLHPEGTIRLLDVACGSGVWGIGRLSPSRGCG